MDILCAALDYAGRGWPVFPLLPVTKQPFKGSHGDKDATIDAGQVRQWWTETPKANIGVAMGRDAGVLALDVDPRHDGDRSLETLEATHGAIPATVESATGSGGRHLLFAHPGGVVRNSQSALAKGLDVKADGGYIVAPPSIHPNGELYEWRNPPDTTPVAPPPGWLVDNQCVTERADDTLPSPSSLSRSALALSHSRRTMR